MSAADTTLGKFRVEAPGFTISVESECGRILEQIERYLLPWLPRAAFSNAAVDVNIRLRRNSPPNYFQLEVNGVNIASNETMPYLFTLIQQAADDRMIHSLRHQTAIHAGAVVYRDRAIVLPGVSGSGKSSLVQELLRQGAEYSSDEYAIFDSQGSVHPYPRALMMRRGSHEQYPVLAPELHATVRNRTAPVVLFLFLRYDAGAAGLDIHPLERSEALIRLLQNTPHVMAEKPDVLHPLKAAVSLAASYAGVRGEVSGAASEILRMAAEAP